MYVAYLVGCNKKIPAALIVDESLENCCLRVEKLYSSFKDSYHIIKHLSDEDDMEKYPDGIWVKSPNSEFFEIRDREDFFTYDGEVEYHFTPSLNRGREIIPESMKGCLRDNHYPNEVACCDLVITIHHIPKGYEGNILKYLDDNIAYLIT